MVLFIPDQYFMKKRVTGKQGFIAFAQQKVDLCFGLEGVKFFYDACRQDHIADKRCLNDQDLFHGGKSTISGTNDRDGGILIPSHDGGRLFGSSIFLSVPY